MKEERQEASGKRQESKKPGTPSAQKANVRAELEQLNEQVTALTEALQRERADAENLRRRHEQQVANIKTVVKADIVRELLPVIDNVERALQHVPTDLDDNDFVKGVQGVAKQFGQTLEKLGVQRIKTVGEPFDPVYHEAISMEAGEGDQEVVSEELQAGYVLGERVIRHAMVRVRS
jgi:molecular chaperone GrpE